MTATATATGSGPVVLAGVHPTAVVHRLASGRLLLDAPYQPDLAPAMRSLRAHRVHITPAASADAKIEGAVDGQAVVHVAKGERPEAGSRFAWTVAAGREADLCAVLLNLYPGRDAAAARLSAFAGLHSGVQVTVTADGRLAIQSPYDRRLDLKQHGGRWDPTSKAWLVSAAAADRAAAHLRHIYGTVEAQQAAQEAAVAIAEQEITAALAFAVNLPAGVTADRTTRHTIRIDSPYRPDLPAAMRARGGRFIDNRWEVPAATALDALRVVQQTLGTADAPLPDPASDGGSPALPWGTRRRNSRAGNCETCDTHVPADGGVLARCFEEHEDRHGGWDGMGGLCEGDRWHVTCPKCAWQSTYRTPDPMPWVALALPACRVSEYLAAGLTPTEAAEMEQDGTYDAATLNTLAALRKGAA